MPAQQPDDHGVVIVDKHHRQQVGEAVYVEPGSNSERELLRNSPPVIIVGDTQKPPVPRWLSFKLAWMETGVGTAMFLAGTEVHVNSFTLALIGGILAILGITTMITRGVRAAVRASRGSGIDEVLWLTNCGAWKGTSQKLSPQLARAVDKDPSVATLIGQQARSAEEVDELKERIAEGQKMQSSVVSTPVGNSVARELEILQDQLNTAVANCNEAAQAIEAVLADQKLDQIADKYVAEQNAAQAWLDEQD